MRDFKYYIFDRMKGCKFFLHHVLIESGFLFPLLLVLGYSKSLNLETSLKMYDNACSW